MPWKYSQSTGELINPTGSRVGYGYSGHGVGLDNPKQQAVADVGPIPAGTYTIGRFFDDSNGKGPIVAHLVPDVDTDTFGRSGFMIHGDNQAVDHSASHGCVILPRVLREQIMASNDRVLLVTA
jgi:lipoprotein-anchoring transpeptidase ErfK/SrfK